MKVENEEIKSFILESLKEGKDFIITQAPDVIQQVISYSYMMGMIGFIFFTIILAFSISAIYLSIRYDREWSTALFAGGLISGIISLLCSYVSLTEMIHAYYFPKSYLLNMFL